MKLEHMGGVNDIPYLSLNAESRMSNMKVYH